MRGFGEKHARGMVETAKKEAGIQIGRLWTI
jgi:hypothetical protein